MTKVNNPDFSFKEGILDSINTNTWTINSSSTGTNATSAIDYWRDNCTNVELGYTYYYPNYTHYYFIDKCQHAYEIVKGLVKADLLVLKTAKEFMDAMDVVLKVV